jgi:2-dehydro-3-deoxyphosphogluconate aldolase/(4S)-4-hydroxy-2-oxoglutarate aldolase
MGETDVVRRLEETRVVAIIRDVPLEHARILGEALVLGGVRAIEVSFTTPDAIPFIERLSGDLGSDIAVGAGTVLDGPTARSAILAGASFVLSPALSPEVIRVCRRYGVPAIPGADVRTANCLHVRSLPQKALWILESLPHTA